MLALRSKLNLVVGLICLASAALPPHKVIPIVIMGILGVFNILVAFGRDPLTKSQDAKLLAAEDSLQADAAALLAQLQAQNPNAFVAVKIEAGKLVASVVGRVDAVHRVVDIGKTDATAAIASIKADFEAVVGKSEKLADLAKTEGENLVKDAEALAKKV